LQKYSWEKVAGILNKKKFGRDGEILRRYLKVPKINPEKCLKFLVEKYPCFTGFEFTCRKAQKFTCFESTFQRLMPYHTVVAKSS
jgi:hypothetical protein